MLRTVGDSAFKILDFGRSRQPYGGMYIGTILL